NIQPNNATLRLALVHSLEGRIRTAKSLNLPREAAEVQQELEKLQSSDPTMVALDARLSAIVKGGQSPKDNGERLPLAQRAFVKKLYAMAAHLWAEALEAEPKLGDDRQAQHRYNAACAAALAVAPVPTDRPEDP